MREQIQTKCRKLLLSRHSYCVTRRLAAGLYLFSLMLPLKVSSFIGKGNSAHKPMGCAQNSKVNLSLPALNAGAQFSSLPINALCGIKNKQAEKNHTCSGRYPFSLVIFLQVSGTQLLPFG